MRQGCFAIIMGSAICKLAAQNLWTPNYEILGGEPMSRIAAAAWSVGRLDLFWAGTDNRLKHRWTPYQGGWSFDEDLGGELAEGTGPAVASDKPGNLDVFWRDTLGRLRWLRQRNFGNWDLSASDLGPIEGPPAVCSWGEGRLDVFWRGNDGHLKHIWQASPGKWNGFVEDLGGSISAGTTPACCSQAAGSMDLVWRGADGSLRWKSERDFGHWGLDLGLGPIIPAGHSPTVCSFDLDRLDVFWRSASNTLSHTWKAAVGGWYGAVEDLAGAFASDPDVVSWGGWRMDVFGRSALPGKPILHRAWSESAWHNRPPVTVSETFMDRGIYTSTTAIWEWSALAAPASTSGRPRFYMTGTDFALPGVNAGPVLFELDAEVPASNLGDPAKNPPNLHALRTGLSSDTVAGPAASFVEQDNAMALTKSGRVVLARGYVESRQVTSFPGTETQRTGTTIHASPAPGEFVLCGTPPLPSCSRWPLGEFIDPANPNIEGGRFAYDFDPSQGDIGGWDREELYADPWTGRLFLAVNAATGTQRDGKRSFADLLFRSDNDGKDWSYTLIRDNYAAQPYYMTSLPGVLFLFHVSDSMMTLRWSWDDGQTIEPAATAGAQTTPYGGAHVFYAIPGQVPTAGGFSSRPNQFGYVTGRFDGSLGISRVGSYILDGTLWHEVRVHYPCVVSAGGTNYQLLRVVSVAVPQAAKQASQVKLANVATLVHGTEQQPTGHILQATAIQNDPVQYPSLGALGSSDSTSVLFYRRQSLPGNDNDIQAIVIRDSSGFAVPISLPRTAFNLARTFVENFAANISGDFIRGAYYYDRSRREHRFLIPWIENRQSIHVAGLSVPGGGVAFNPQTLLRLSATPQPVGNGVELVLQSERLRDIEVQFSDDLITWRTDSVLSDVSPGMTRIRTADASQRLPLQRFYRLVER